jgi:uncharacterized protein (TIGR02001 family)
MTPGGRLRCAPPLAVLLATGFVVPAQAETKIGVLDLTLTGAVTAANDYIFRGISLTGRRPALQGSIEVDHPSGLYFGVFTSNDHFGTATVEVDPSAGYRFDLHGIKIDLGAYGYIYPGANAQPFSYNYAELGALVSYEIGIATVRLNNYFASSNQFGSGAAYYAEIGADLRLPHDFTLSGRVGYQVYTNHGRIGLPDYLNWSIALYHDLPFNLLASVGYYQTNISKEHCGGQNSCGAAGLVTITYKF